MQICRFAYLPFVAHSCVGFSLRPLRISAKVTLRVLEFEIWNFYARWIPLGTQGCGWGYLHICIFVAHSYVGFTQRPQKLHFQFYFCTAGINQSQNMLNLKAIASPQQSWERSNLNHPVTIIINNPLALLKFEIWCLEFVICFPIQNHPNQ